MSVIPAPLVSSRFRRLTNCAVLIALLATPADAQEAVLSRVERVLSDLDWREVGPYRGGRSCAVVGLPRDRNTFWMGACGGGVWKTVDAGRTWRNVSDGFFGGSIGGIDVCVADPNVVWVGTGEKTVRGNVSHGDGLWRSTDAGRTWRHAGLADTRQIGRVRAQDRVA